MASILQKYLMRIFKMGIFFLQGVEGGSPYPPLPSCTLRFFHHFPESRFLFSEYMHVSLKSLIDL